MDTNWLNWPQLLYTYGPFALLVLVVFVVERRARGLLGKKVEPRWIGIAAYSGTWLSVFLLCGVVTVAWLRRNMPREAVISGRFEDVEGQAMITSRSQHLYLRRDYDRPGPDYDYDWRLISPEPLPSGAKVVFFFQRGSDCAGRSLSDCTSERVTKHELTIRPEFYTTPVTLAYRRTSDQVVLVSADGKETELKGTLIGDAGNEEGVERGWLPVALANADASVEAIARQMEANDPIIREEARLALAKKGSAGLPVVERVLAQDDASNRLRLGAVVALLNMDAAAAAALSERGYVGVERAASDRDRALRARAIEFLYGHPRNLTRVEGTAAARVSTKGSVTVPVRPASGGPEMFRFQFDHSAAIDGRMSLDLVGFQNVGGGALPGTHWAFDVLGDAQLLMTVSETRVFDPTVPPPQEEATRATASAAKADITLRVVGIRLPDRPAVQ